MGSLFNTVFTMLLGWVRTVSASIWRGLTRPDGGSMGWLGENWQFLALALCALGLALDLAVYLIRWQPYRVWRRFFRELRGRKERNKSSSMEDEGDMPEKTRAYGGVPTKITKETEEVSRLFPDVPENEFVTEPEPETLPDRKRKADPLPSGGRPVLPVREKSRRAFPETPAPWNEDPEEDTEPGKLPSWKWERTEDSPVSGAAVRGYYVDQETEGGPEDSGTTERFQQAIIPRRRRRVRNLFSESEQNLSYTAPQELIDRREAYRRPVYPRNWKGGTGQGDEDD